MTNLLFIESIRLENGKFSRLHYHQQRMDTTIRNLSKKENTISLTDVLYSLAYPSHGLFKCRVVYDAEAVRKVEFIPYFNERPVQMRIIRINRLNYDYKFEDRSELEKLKPAKPKTDIIISKRGKITDALYSNLAFFDGLRWLTPAEPLLKGTMRQALLDAGEIYEDEISEKDICKFSHVKRINAMLQFDEPALPVTQIIW